MFFPKIPARPLSIFTSVMSRPFALALLASRLAFASAVVLSPVAGLAQQPAAMAPDRPFTLDDAIGMAMKKNFDLQLQAYNVENAKDTIEIAKGGFDANLTATVRRNLSQAASNTSRLDGSQLAGPRNDNTTVSVGANERLAATNGTVSVTTNVTRGATNSTNALLNPSYGNGISASLSQPLLQNAGRTTATATLERAKLGLNIATIAYKSRVLTVIQQTEVAYYNLVAAREALRIRQLTFEYNQKLFEENQARRATGVATDLDVFSAEYGMANSRRAVVQQEQAVRDAEDNLLNLINAPELDVRPGPVAFNDYTEGPPNFAASYKRAREFFPDTLSAEETIKQLQITLAVAKRNMMPTLNLDASLGYTARAVNSGFGDAIGNLPNDHGNNWSFGLTYQRPWGNRADKASYRSALSSLNSRKLTLEQLEQSLLVNVRSAVRAVETNLMAVEIAGKATALSAKQYELQKARFDAGLSTSRLVLQAQDDLESARNAELTAKLALRRAVAELHRLEGTSIERFRVQLPQ